MHNPFLLLISLTLGVFCTDGWTQELAYNVNGYSGNVYVYGELTGDLEDTAVEGYVFDEDGNGAYFTGDWIGNGEFEGYDEEDNFYQLELEIEDE